MTKDNKTIFNLIIGALIGLVVSCITILIQHAVNNKEKQVQLYLDEKKGFVLACDDYLKQYRQWHELMNYCVTKDSSANNTLSNFNNVHEFNDTYRKWKIDFDFAYGRIFLLSDNEFGTKTLMVSTVLHNSLRDIISNNYRMSQKQDILNEVDAYFFKNWLQEAQKEIFRYNSGTRDQKSIQEFISEQKKANQKEKENDSLDLEMYKGLSKAYQYMKKQDTLNSAKKQMPNIEVLDSLSKIKN